MAESLTTSPGWWCRGGRGVRPQALPSSQGAEMQIATGVLILNSLMPVLLANDTCFVD